MAFSKRAAKVKEQVMADVAVASPEAPDASPQRRAEERLPQEPDSAGKERDRIENERAERERRARQAEQDELGRRRQAADEARRTAAEQDEQRRKAEAPGLRPAGGFAGSQRPESGLRPAGGFAAGQRPESTPGAGGFSWKRGGAAAQQGGAAAQQPGRPLATFGKGAGRAEVRTPLEVRAPPVNPRFAGLPSHDDCELGVSAIISKTQNGMKEGLRSLGLPDFPLVFAPGKSLWLCGHDVREEVNGMIHAWMTNDTDDFYKSLAHIKEKVATPMLTEEEYEMMDHAQKADWVPTAARAPDGTALYVSKKDAGAATVPPPPNEEEEEDDDEVIDVTPAGIPLQAAGAAAAPDAQTPAAVQQDPADGGADAEDDDYYGVLGVVQTAGVQEIRSKFRALISVHHPEKGGDRKMFEKLNKAYSVLVDAKKRQEFDALLASRASLPASRGPASTPGGYPAKAFVD